MVLTGAYDGSVKLWPLKNVGLGSTPVAEFYDHENPVLHVALSGDGKYAASGANDGKIIVWDTKSGSEVLTYQGGQAGRSFGYLIYFYRRLIFLL